MKNKIIAALSVALVLVVAFAVSQVVFTASNHSPNALRIDDSLKLTAAQTESAKAHQKLAYSQAAVVAFETDAKNFRMKMECPVEDSLGSKFSKAYALAVVQAGPTSRISCSMISDAAKNAAAEWTIVAKADANRVKNADEDLAIANRNHAATVVKMDSLKRAVAQLEYAIGVAGLLALGLVITIIANRKKN
jgi:hypothetical protein